MWPLIDVLAIDSKFRTEKSSFRAIPETIELNEIFEQLVDEQKISNTKMAKILNVNKNSVQAWCGHAKMKPHPIPIWVLNFLISKTENNFNIRMKINYLINKVRSGRFGTIQSFPKNLNPELAAFVGAHAADGCLYQIPKRNAINWDLAEQQKKSMELISIWIKNNFKLELNVRKHHNANAWYLYTRKQILPRFLIGIFDMPIGEKHEIVREPKILHSPEIDGRLLTKPSISQKKELEFSFASGVMIFDGHCTISGSTPAVGLGSNSKQLLQDMLKIFRENGIEFKDYTKHRKILTTSFSESKKFFDINCFKDTPKQMKLGNILSRFKKSG